MGKEANCGATYGTKSGTGKLHYACLELSFRGEFLLKINTVEATKWSADNGELSCMFKGQPARFTLGSEAEKWLAAILNPPKLLDKLGVKPGQRIALMGDFDDEFLASLQSRCTEIINARAKNCDIVMLRADCLAKLELQQATAKITRAGMIWVVWPKGRKEFREDDIRDEALKGILVDVKVCAFSEALSALKLVIRKELR